MTVEEPVAATAWRPGRALRACAGVDEAVLAQCRWERFRYTGVGGAVLGTACLAAFSMALAIETATDQFGPWHLMAAVGWGLFILNLDRWMVASTHGLGRKSTLLPRLALAVVFGFVIAEPMVLRIFSSAIETHIADTNRESAKNFEALLTRCNPANPADVAAAAASPECADAVLNVDPPDALEGRLADLAAQRDLARAQLAAVQADLTETIERLQREAAGDRGTDTSGKRGVGPIARALEADVIRLTGERDAAQQRVDSLDNQYQTLAATTEVATTSYGDRVATAIQSRVADERSKLERKPGLLERIEALSELTASHAHLLTVRWFLTMFFVAVDSLPVLVKMLSGTSTYDRLLQSRLSAAERTDRHAMQIAEATLLEERDLERFAQQQHALVGRESIALDTRRRLRDLDQRAAAMGMPPTGGRSSRATWDGAGGRGAGRDSRGPDRQDRTYAMDADPIDDIATFLARMEEPSRWRPRRRPAGTDATPERPPEVRIPPPASPLPVDDIVPNGHAASVSNGHAANGSAGSTTALLDAIRAFQDDGGWDKLDGPN